MDHLHSYSGFNTACWSFIHACTHSMLLQDELAKKSEESPISATAAHPKKEDFDTGSTDIDSGELHFLSFAYLFCDEK